MAKKYSKVDNEELVTKYHAYVRAQLALRKAMEDKTRADASRKFAEKLYERLFGGTPEKNNNPSFDLTMEDGKQIQVKLAWKAEGNPAGLELKPHNFAKPRAKNFDILAVFWIDETNGEGRIKHFVEVPLSDLKKTFGTTQKTKQFHPEDFPDHMRKSHKRLQAAAKRHGLESLLNLSTPEE